MSTRMNKGICPNWIEGIKPDSWGDCKICRTLCDRKWAEKNHKECPYTGYKNRGK